MATSLDPDAIAIGQAVRGAIAAAGLNQAEAATRAGIAVNTFSRRVNGLIPFTWPELVRISRVTGVPCSELAASATRISEQRAEAALSA